MLMEFAQTIEGTAVNGFVLGHWWLWPLMETLHFIGLSMLLGALIVIDLRLAGFVRAMSYEATHRLLPLVFIGFGINLVTGILFYFGDPLRYTANIGFWFKMGLVLIAGLNALLYYWKIDPKLGTWGPHDDSPALAKTVAVVSLVCWTGVLLLGRRIPYVGTG